MLRIYGLEKCSTCEKTRNWLDRKKIAHAFVDYREQRIDAATLKTWAKAVGGWEKLVNRAGMTWRNLLPARKSPGSDAEWLLLIKEYPALVRRPVAVLRERGQWQTRETDGLPVLVTLHPSALLRLRGGERDAAFDAWLHDLSQAAEYVSTAQDGARARRLRLHG